MPKITFGELREKITGFIGDRTDDEALSILEDVADTLTEEPEDWHEKYNQLDADWRKRYRDRFNGKPDQGNPMPEPEPEPKEETISISDILKES